MLTNHGSSRLPARMADQTGPVPDWLDSLFMLSPALLCIASTDGYLKRVNPAFHKVLGHTEAVLLSRPFIEFVHPDDRQATLEELSRLSTGIPAVHFENRYVHADGSYRWLLWNSTPVAEKGLLYATALDITERRHADELFRNLMHAAPDATIITDHQTKILKVNRATEALFGYPANELVGQSIEVLVPARLRGKHQEHLSAYTNDPRPRMMGGGLDLFGLRKDGSEFPADISVGPVETAQGRIFICAVRDYSLRKQRERELRDRELELVENQCKLEALAARLVLAEERERRRIAIGLHDDVGQTLAAVKMSLDQLLEGDLRGDADSSARQAQGLVDHAIQATRTLTFELASAALYEVGLGAALRSVCERAAQKSGIRFQPPSDLQGNPIPEKTRVVLYRAGRELIRNIVKHSKARTAKLSLTLNGNRIRLTVEDDGRGFDASEKLQWRDAQAGIGLLSINQQLDPIGGRLEIESSPGSGTRAVVIVPLDSSGDRT